MKKVIYLAIMMLTASIAVCAQTNDEKKSNIIHLTKSEFIAKVCNYKTDGKEFEYKNDKPAIVDFYADWCGPCRKLSPILEEIAEEYDGKIIIYKVNTDKEPEIASAFGIRALPTLLFIPTEGETSHLLGLRPKEELCKAIETTLLKKETSNE